jgi:hypothetical protein
MSIFFVILLTIIGTPVLIYTSINLLGMVVRGFFRDSSLEKMKNDEETHEFIKSEINKHNRAGGLTTVIFIILALVVFYVLYTYVNIWCVLAVLLLMFSRTPDLLLEIRTGKKFDRNNKPKGVVYAITDVTMPLAMISIAISLFLFFNKVIG